MPGRLKPNEVEYAVAIEDLSEKVRAESVGMVRRAAVVDTVTGDTDLLVDWGAPRQSVWACTDGGSDTWQHRLKMFYKYQVRGSEKYDPPHREVRVRDKAINQSDGGWIKSEFGVCFAYVRGPWTSGSNFQLVGGGSRELFANFDENFSLFKDFMYERICRSKNRGRLPLGYGTPEHLKQTWQLIQKDKVIVGLSADYSANRWKSWTDRFQWYWESFDVLLLIALYILTTRGCLKNLEQDFPNLMGIQKFLELMGGSFDESDLKCEDLDIKDLKAASKALGAKRHKGSGSLWVVAESLSNTTTRKLGYATCHVPRPLEEKLMADITQSGTQVGCVDWHVAQACGTAYGVVREIFKTLEDLGLP
jgi:hypothetical protein